jgi:iron complex transport system substrate-binding protein
MLNTHSIAVLRSKKASIIETLSRIKLQMEIGLSIPLILSYLLMASIITAAPAAVPTEPESAGFKHIEPALVKTDSVKTAAIEVIDDAGRQVRLIAPAQRIISLAPSMTELLFSIGAGGRVVGVIDYSDYPVEALSLPVIGRHDLLDMEAIVALQPDLIVAWQSGNPRSSLRRLEELGFAVYIAEPSSLDSIADQVERLSVLSGLPEQGAQLAAQFRQELKALAETHQGVERVSVFYQVWHSPLISVGGGELINDIISLCGGSNIFADLAVGPKVSVEGVLQHNPDVIIASGMDIARPEWLDDWLRWPHLKAVQNQQLYFIPPDLVQRHSLRALQGASLLCQHLDETRR